MTTPDRPVEARPAASVLLVRDVPPPGPGLDVFMAQRHVASAFVGGAYVFPGGRVDPADAIDPALLSGLDAPTANRRLGLTEGGLAHYVAAIRESFEEAGVLLAYDRSGLLLDLRDPARAARFEELRRRLNAGELTLADIAAAESLRLALDRLEYWSHWITPAGEPRRFDTRFFLARAPEGQRAAHDRYELTGSAWVPPADAIAKALRHEWMVIFPTLMNLKDLGRHPTVDAALAWARTQPLPRANQPRLLDGRVVLPGDDGYEQAREDFSGVDPAVFERSFEP